MIATQNTPLSGKKPMGMSKVSFYHRNNRSMLAERGLVSISKQEPPKSEDNRASTFSTITKTQERQIKAKQNLESLAQRDADRLNHMALNSVKK
jgi:hypothetical protein